MEGVKKGEMPFIDFSEEPPVLVEERQPYDMEKDVAPAQQKGMEKARGHMAANEGRG